MRRSVAAFLALVGPFFVGAHIASADTPPNVWDIAKDPQERDRWALHVRVERLLESQNGIQLDKELALEAARQMLEEAHAADSPDVRLRFDLGIVYERLANDQQRDDLHERAVELLAPALHAAPDHPAAMLALEALVDAYTRLDRTADEVATARLYIDRLTDDADRIVAMMNMGEAEMKLGRLDTAIGTFRRVLEICGSLPNLSLRNSTYALTLWDLAVALDRTGDNRTALEDASKAMKLVWEEVDRKGHPRLLNGWEAIHNEDPNTSNVYFVPDWERHWYLALGNAVLARETADARESADFWAASEAHWEIYVAKATASRQDTYLAIARLRYEQARTDHAAAEKRAGGARRRSEGGNSGRGPEHRL
jgi:tetratricopeptide (TPR) repeat protein